MVFDLELTQHDNAARNLLVQGFIVRELKEQQQRALVAEHWPKNRISYEGDGEAVENH